MEILAIDRLSFTYPGGEAKALEDISLSVQAGEFVVVCGKSGCGKTTLLRLLKRELAPHGERRGSVLYKGVPDADLDERTAACDIGYVMQNPDNQLVTDKVWHELSFGLENMGVEQGVIRRRVGEMASFFGIDGFFREETAKLSGGQKQLLNLASIMVMAPSVLILDEPTSQLDPIAAADFIAMLQKINRELGLTILLVEHRLEEVFPIADKVLVLDEGKRLLYDGPREVGRLLKETAPRHGMLRGLPTAVRLYNGLESTAPCPLTVREGRDFLSEVVAVAPPVQVQPAPPPATPAGPPAVEVKNAWFRYEKELPDVLTGAALRVHGGQVTAVLGGNGAGKTTLLKVISAQEKAYRGSVRVLGKKLKEYKGNDLYRHTLALLPQNPQTLFLKNTVREDYDEMGKVMEYSKERRESMLCAVAEKLGITHLLGRHPYDLSGGEQQKVALGKVLLLQPRVLLLDEPTKGIDADSKHRLGGILAGLKEEGLAVLMVTHDVEFAAENADRCTMLFDGQVNGEETPEGFFSGNQFYTTAANRMARHLFPRAITCGGVLAACRAAGKEGAPCSEAQAEARVPKSPSYSY